MGLGVRDEENEDLASKETEERKWNGEEKRSRKREGKTQERKGRVEGDISKIL